jgi:hypothetical protein
MMDLLLPALGVLGAALILLAYGAAQLDVLDPRKASSLALNFLGASLILVSMLKAFNVAAFLVEGAWALIALLGLIRLWSARRKP